MYFNTYADEKDFYNIISLIVDEDSYDEISAELIRYSRDVQWVLENTRVVILPTPSDASVVDIASLNESLYFEWYKGVRDSVDFESRLIGSVFVGDIPLPSVFDGWKSRNSILPYIDFEDKSYIYNHDSENYEKNPDATTKTIPEVWHGVISPNTWTDTWNLQALEDYFDKNHDFYAGNGVFDQDLWVIDGQNTPADDDYEPSVFYYDAFRENEALQYESYIGYKSYLENIEDIAYNRFSAELAERVTDDVLWSQNDTIADLISNVDPSFDISWLSSWPDASSSSDILTRYITNNTTNSFLEIFNSSALWDMRKHVYNAGRYNEWGSRVNIDMPPFLISVLDGVWQEIIKNVNTELEREITDIVANGLSRNIRIPVRIQWACGPSYENFYYGLWARWVESASQCSIYRWSAEDGGQLVEANRGRNINLVRGDTDLCAVEMRVSDTTGRVTRGIESVWWGNTPVNLAWWDTAGFNLSLWDHNPRHGVTPVFDILGSQEISDTTRVPSPVDCFEDGVFVQVESKQTREHTYTVTNSSGDSEERTHNYCDFEYVITVPETGVVGVPSTLDYYRTLSHDNGHDQVPISKAQSLRNFCSETWIAEIPMQSLGALSPSTYKNISSHIVHTSPTSSEFGLQVNSLFTPSLPIDVNRYIDFIWANGQWADYGYRRIDFPQLFRVSLNAWEELTLDSTATATRRHLDEVSAQINTIRTNSNPSSLAWADVALYNDLSTGAFPSTDIDLYQFLQDKPREIFSQDGQSKEISYFDTLVFAVYWNSLNTPSSKYKFIFEEYLSNEFRGNDYDFHLPRVQSSYEIWYFAAPGDAQNMYIKLDPESKWTHPYADILAANLALDTTLLTANAANPREIEGVFECAPPGWVNIFQWIPAVVCWLQNMLPPTISIGQWSCGSSDLFLSEDELDEVQSCQWDINGNGISDCIERNLVGGSLALSSNAGRYFYNSPGTLLTQVYRNNGALARFDSNSYVSTVIERVEVPSDSSEIFEPWNLRVIYDRSIPSLSTVEAYREIQAYLSFSDSYNRVNTGESTVYFYAKWQDANITFSSSLEHISANWDLVVDLQSTDQTIQIRGDRVFINTYNIDNDGTYFPQSTVWASNLNNICIVDGWSDTISNHAVNANGLSSAEEKLLLLIENYSLSGNRLELNYPLDVNISRNGEVVYSEDGITANSLGSVLPVFAGSRSGQYIVQIRDSFDFVSERSFTILPDTATTIDPTISTNVIETGWNISTHLFTILDRYDNPANGEIYSVEMSLSGWWLEFAESWEREIEYNVVDGYKAFRLRSTDEAVNNTITFRLRNLSGDVIDTSTERIRTIDDIDMTIGAPSIPAIAGWERVSYNVNFTDGDGNLLSDLNSRVYFSLQGIYGTVDTPYVEVIWGRAEVGFTPNTLAARNIPVELQLEWWNEIYIESIEILPETPIKIDLFLSRDKIEASESDSTILEATLKDRYDNDVFTDNTTVLDLEIPVDSRNVISVDESSQTLIDGKTQFRISWTDIPGVWYFIVNSRPDLSDNSFILEGQAPFDRDRLVIPTMTTSGDELTATWRRFFRDFSQSHFITRFVTKSQLEANEAYLELPSVLQTQISDFWDSTNGLSLNWIGQNAWSVESFYFWDSDDIDGNSYNTLYSVLLGAPYWDITQENYLAGSMLFDPDNNALAVTSLLQNPYKFHDVFSLSQNWALASQRSRDITQDIEFVASTDNDGRLVFDIHNNALEEYVGRTYYNLSDSRNVSLNIEASSGYRAETFGWNNIRLRDGWGRSVFEILSEGRFNRFGWVSLDLDRNYNWPWLALSLTHGDEIVAQLILNDTQLWLNVTRDQTILNNELQILDDTIILHLQSNSYASRIQDMADGWEILNVYYKDPFAAKYSLDEFHTNDITGIESSYSEEGIGWKDSNTMLLSFAAWANIGDSTKEFQSFSLINLGDPVVSLKNLDVTFPNSTAIKSFDSTLWEIIENDETLIGYQVFDYNNDDKKDILTIHKDGYLKLHEQRDLDGDFVYQRSYWYAADWGSVRLVKTGDFTGDGYGDIFFVDDGWQPALFNNVLKDISRIDISSQISLSGSIIQAETYDMDSDGNDDIVTLDDAGEIHIFYGWGIGEAPAFTKQFIGNGYGIELSNSTISHWWAVYFDGLVQVSNERAQDILSNSSEYLSELQANLELDGGTPVTPEYIDSSLIDSFLYVGIPYTPTDGPREEIDQSAIVSAGISDQINSIWESVPSEDLSVNATAINDFIENYDAYTSYRWFSNEYTSQTYFIRSQYADTAGLEITKTFTDTSAPNLQTWDTIYFDVTLRNTWSTPKNNIAYVDILPQYFSFASEEFEVLSEGGRMVPMRRWVGQYNILIDGLSLWAWEETIVRFELIALPVSHGHIQVWLYEDGEVGDDIYGDIIVKDDDKNCWSEADIYRSTSQRWYERGLTTPVCSAADIDVGNSFPELVDLDNNGIPDYLETLLETDSEGNIVPTGDFGAIEDYSTDILWGLAVDTDGDGIPDSDDSLSNTDAGSDFMAGLANIEASIEDISEDIDTLIEWLSCGFWGGSCIATPLNWAPLAPWNDPTLFGAPIGDGLRVDEGIPIFSALTGLPVPVTWWCIEVPATFPPAIDTFDGRCFSGNGAGWSLWVRAPSNFVRLFVTPTLTWWVGLAACFGWPAIVAWNSNPMGSHPIVPGGNCIIAAMPLFNCEWWEWDPWVEWYPYPGWDFGVIHANCDGASSSNLATPLELESSFVLDYLNYMRSWVQPAGMYDRYLNVFDSVSENPSGNYYLPTEPLINIGWGEGIMSANVDLDVSALAAWDFGDAIQIQNTRVAGFPWFLMDWVERQLDEVTSKLTNLSKIFVILPDFGWIFDFSWQDFSSQTGDLFNASQQENDNSRELWASELSALRAQKTNLDCNGDDALRCRMIDLKLVSQNGENYVNSWRETLSWIKEVYAFLGNVPLVNIESETINVSVPWIEPSQIDRSIVDWEYALEQYKWEFARASASWSAWAACSGTAGEIARCQRENDIAETLNIQTWQFIGSLETNIQILQEYKEFPDRLAELINIKEVWLEQILCNIEAISSLVGEWISTNGERFQAWVELYILIKAVLQSWQLFIDVFNGYEAECHECKNERQDLQGFFFQLISAVIPSPPIIEFPKWPDIIIDLHNIRAGINIYMPDFAINLRPIVLPTLPGLQLPDTPDIRVNIPSLPLLPRFELPELPELPSLPTVELPDLPPPPNIPRLFGAVEGVLNIVKLITKAMCILKSSPFVPEWRAWDQIAFLTERNGYLPTDFINIQPPAFSYSMISAIKVTSYVNFEFETEFILEAVRAVMAPLDDSANNIVNMFDTTLWDLDFSNLSPNNIDVDIESSGDIDVSVDGNDISLAPLDENPEGIYFIAALMWKKFTELLSYTSTNVWETLSNDEFLSSVNHQLASSHIVWDPRMKELRDLWKNVSELTYSAEQTFIDELRENSTQKFETLEGILSTEIEYSKKQLHELRTLGAPDFIGEVMVQQDSRTGVYSDMMEPYNIKTLDSAIALAGGPSEETQEFQNGISDQGDDIMNQVRGWLESYKKNTLLAAVPSWGWASPTGGSCQSDSSYQYVYEGIYIKEDGRNYKLFDYTEPLRGDEVPTISDMDNDGDNDVLYLVGGKLYLKENRANAPSENYFPTPLILRSGQNKFYNGDTYYEAVNGFMETSVSDGAINIEFAKPTNTNLESFRLEYHTLVDRYIDDGNNLPAWAQTHIVDAVANIDERSPTRSTPEYEIYDNPAVLSYAGSMNNLTLTTPRLVNIADDLRENREVVLTSNTVLYAWGARFTIRYRYPRTEEELSVTVPEYSMISFERPVEIQWVSWDAYVSLGILEDIQDADIIDYIGMPILPWAHFSYDGDQSLLWASAHVDIRYYDGSEALIDIRDVASYRLYDLGNNYGDSYRIRMEIPNDFYYARLAAFEDDILSTWSKQILLSPQEYSDTLAPQIALNQDIRIPVYQMQRVDLTPYIYEDGGLSGIIDVRVDFDANTDSDGDGNSENDRDSENISIYRTPVSIEIEFGAYDTLFTRNIVIALTDDNGNVWQAQIPFEVYAPEPNIYEVEGTRIYGRIDEELSDEPVRLYRYRWWVVERLETVTGEGLSLTSGTGAYDFDAAQDTSWVTLSYSWRTLATIDEYTGRIDISDAFTSTRVLPSNSPLNTSAYPEVQILLAGNPIFRQFVTMPTGEISVVADASSWDATGMYLQVLDQSTYNTYRVPLDVPYNPGSVSVYRNSDSSRQAIMTVFRDGRINIDSENYRLEYRTLWEDASFVLVDIVSGVDITQLVYNMDASYILR